METEISNLKDQIVAPKQLDETSEQLLEAWEPQATVSTLEQDDDCVICYQTLYRPARTECGHSACESCLLHWALTTMETKFGDVNAPEISSNIALAVDGIKFKCPTCRTYTQASFDAERNEKLTERYREEYISRDAEISNNSPLVSEDGTELVFLMIGNSHRKIPATFDPHTGMEAEHEWTFFVKGSNQDVIDKVEVILHPSYREHRLAILNKAPFTITRLCRAYFTIFAGIVLKEGWEWVGEEMIVDSDADNGRVRDRLPVKWLLDFSDGGRMRTQTVKVKKVKQPVSEGTDRVMDDRIICGTVPDCEEDADFGAMAAFMSEREIAQLREVRIMKRRALKEKETLAKSK